MISDLEIIDKDYSTAQALINEQLADHLVEKKEYLFNNAIYLISDKLKKEEEDAFGTVRSEKYVTPEKGIYLGFNNATKKHRFRLDIYGHLYYVSVFLFSEKLWSEKCKSEEPKLTIYKKEQQAS